MTEHAVSLHTARSRPRVHRQRRRGAVKVAAICPSPEKERHAGKLVFRFVPKGTSSDTACVAAMANLRRILPLLKAAARRGVRMACLPEDLLMLTHWMDSATPRQRLEAARKTWPTFCAVLSEEARRWRMVLVAGSYEPRGRRIFNAAAIWDERGRLLGTYHKVQLAKGEAAYLSPGRGFPVFRTRFGNVGILICWDIIYPEVTQALMLNGADVLFEPTWGHSGPQADFTAQARAHDAVCPLVIAMWGGAGRIVDKDGLILARGRETRNRKGLIPDRIVVAEINPKAPRRWLCHKDLRRALIRARQWRAYRCLSTPRTP